MRPRRVSWDTLSPVVWLITLFSLCVSGAWTHLCLKPLLHFSAVCEHINTTWTSYIISIYGRDCGCFSQGLLFCQREGETTQHSLCENMFKSSRKINNLYCWPSYKVVAEFKDGQHCPLVFRAQNWWLLDINMFYDRVPLKRHGEIINTLSKINKIFSHIRRRN